VIIIECSCGYKADGDSQLEIENKIVGDGGCVFLEREFVKAICPKCRREVDLEI